MYFLQHLLFPGKLVSAQDNDEEVKPEAVTGRITKFDDLDEQQRIRVSGLAPEVQRLLFDFEKMPLVSTPTSFPPGFPVDALACSLRDPETYTTAVYQCLKAVDPVMAERWHWRDIRKVSRSLQVFLQTGHRHSSIMQEQAETLQEAQYVPKISKSYMTRS